MSRVYKVKLSDQETSLRCRLTGWTISRKEEKNTPSEYSPQVSDWIRGGALLVIDAAGATAPATVVDDDAKADADPADEFMNTSLKGMTAEAVREFARKLNAHTGEETIETKDVSKKNMIASIEKWRDEQNAAMSGD